MSVEQTTVALAVMAHEPDRRLVSLMEEQLPALVQRYAAVMALCSRETHPEVLELLRRHGVAVHLDAHESTGIGRLGDVRREAVRAGLAAGTSHLQLCDYDRALHWAAHYPEELDSVLADIPNYDLLVLGRTNRAWATHPPYQTETERLFNQVFSLVTGLSWDVGAGSRGLSRRAATALLQLSHEPTVGVDAEWPLLLLGRSEFRLGYRPCEGLEFETADRYGPEIEAAGSYASWERQMAADPRRWVFRLRVALMIADAAVRIERENVGRA